MGGKSFTIIPLIGRTHPERAGLSGHPRSPEVSRVACRFAARVGLGVRNRPILNFVRFSDRRSVARDVRGPDCPPMSAAAFAAQAYRSRLGRTGEGQHMQRRKSPMNTFRSNFTAILWVYNYEQLLKPESDRRRAYSPVSRNSASYPISSRTGPVIKSGFSLTLWKPRFDRRRLAPTLPKFGSTNWSISPVMNYRRGSPS